MWFFFSIEISPFFTFHQGQGKIAYYYFVFGKRTSVCTQIKKNLNLSHCFTHKQRKDCSRCVRREIIQIFIIFILTFGILKNIERIDLLRIIKCLKFSSIKLCGMGEK